MRRLSYAQAINEALHQKMASDERVILIGQGVKSPWYVGNTAVGLVERFGEERVIDTPVSENSISGIAVGAALAGLLPVLVFPRMDFMLYAMDQIINHAANWHYMFGGQLSIPLTIWGIINRGGEQAAQHSQSLQAVFAHIPGLKVVMPSTPYDAKGLLLSAIEDQNPVVFIDERWLYQDTGDVPQDLYSVPLGLASTRHAGKDVSIIATSYLANEALKSAGILKEEDISAEVIDLRSIKPLDEAAIFQSVKKTGRALVLDGGWHTCGLAADISARVSEQCFKYLKAPVQRMTLPDAPAAASCVLEKEYYLSEAKITETVKLILRS